MDERFGIFDAPEALARIASLITLDDKSPPARVVELGLALQLLPEGFEENSAHWLHALSGVSLRELPAKTRRIVEQVQLDPVSMAQPEGPRSSKLDYVFDTRCMGPRYNELFDVEGATAFVQLVADRAANLLDAAAQSRDLTTLRDAFVALGVLCLIKPCEVARVRVDQWERAFHQADASQKDDRAYWDPYRRRVWIAFELVKRRFVD